MGAYSKAIVAVVGAVALAAASRWTDETITNPEWVQIAVAGFTAFEVWLVSNLAIPIWHASKFITALALGGLNALAGYLANGQEMSGPLWLNVVIAAAVAAGVWGAPPAPVHAPPR